MAGKGERVAVAKAQTAVQSNASPTPQSSHVLRKETRSGKAYYVRDLTLIEEKPPWVEELAEKLEQSYESKKSHNKEMLLNMRIALRNRNVSS